MPRGYPALAKHAHACPQPACKGLHADLLMKNLVCTPPLMQVDFTAPGSGPRGLVATCDMPPGSKLLTVPHRHCLALPYTGKS
jgi:hypothetical protein